MTARCHRFIWLMICSTVTIASPVSAASEYSGKPLLGLRLPVNSVQPSVPHTPSDSSHLHADSTQSNEMKERKAFPWRATPPESPDYKGAARDAAYFMLYQTLIVAGLYVLPESISGWTDEDKENYSWDTWRENVRNPHWDDDTMEVNYVLHPYWGATYYVRGRERGLSRPQSLARWRR